MQCIEIPNVKDHLACFNYEYLEKPTIEVIEIEKDKQLDLVYDCNKIVFIIEGSLKYIRADFPDYRGEKGNILFIPLRNTYSFKAESDSKIIVFRVHTPLKLCDNLAVESLFKEDEVMSENDYSPENTGYGKLVINVRIWQFLDHLEACISDGLKCRCWFDLKIKEFFVLLRVYYTHKEIHDFLYLILSSNVAFSEYVRENWVKFQSVNEIAESMHMSTKNFSTQFVYVFGKTPYQWMLDEKSRFIYQEIISSDKLFKQISTEYGFASDSLFTRFCKHKFGMTPTEIRDKFNNR